MATVHELSPEGDVKLICGSEEEGNEMHIIVCSAVLRHGSPEGAILATGARLDLSLPDDDAASMLTICQLMHLQSPVPKVLSSGAVLKLARIFWNWERTFALGDTMSYYRARQSPRLRISRTSIKPSQMPLSG
ncbi:hypothetical protein BST61_g1436 [Cercospora zeina]